MSEIGEISSRLIREYCNKWGFGHIIYQDADFDNSRRASWSKINFLKIELSKIELVWWLDCDAFIINPNINVMDYLDERKIFITKDIRGPNCGSMLWRNTKDNLQLLSRIWNHNIDHPWCEQYGFIKEYHNDFAVRARTKILPQNIFNAYLYKELWNKDHAGQFTKDSCVLHLPGISNEERLEWIKKMI